MLECERLCVWICVFGPVRTCVGVGMCVSILEYVFGSVWQCGECVWL